MSHPLYNDSDPSDFSHTHDEQPPSPRRRPRMLLAVSLGVALAAVGFVGVASAGVGPETGILTIGSKKYKCTEEEVAKEVQKEIDKRSPGDKASPQLAEPDNDGGSCGQPAPSGSGSIITQSPSQKPSKPAPSRSPGSGTGVNDARETAVIEIVNTERARAGCSALTANALLTTAARGHSADMANRNYFDHTTPEGVGFSDRITAAGYKWSRAGENIAMGYKDATSVMTGWMNSPGHKANILNCSFKEIGVGVVANSAGRLYWSQEFGTAANAK